MPSTPIADYYALLGVHDAVDGEELRKAWRELAARWHPDRAGCVATGTFQQISAAYDVLSDPVARAAYDRRRRAAQPEGAPRAAAVVRPAGGGVRREVPGVMLSRLCGPLTSLIVCGAARFDDDECITLVFGASEAASGGMVSISMRVGLWCPDCGGRGRSPACGRCGGRGVVEELFSAWLAVPPGVRMGRCLCRRRSLWGWWSRCDFGCDLAGPDGGREGGSASEDGGFSTKPGVSNGTCHSNSASTVIARNFLPPSGGRRR